MKIRILLILSFAAMTLFVACRSGIHHALPEIADADSATIIYYDNPSNDRFFKVAKGKTPAELSSVIEDVNVSVQKVTKASCESFGKIYFYKGTEQVYVVYFSDENCGKLAFIKNGERYESEMSKTSFKRLDEWKLTATEPSAR